MPLQKKSLARIVLLGNRSLICTNGGTGCGVPYLLNICPYLRLTCYIWDSTRWQNHTVDSEGASNGLHNKGLIVTNIWSRRGSDWPSVATWFWVWRGRQLVQIGRRSRCQRGLNTLDTKAEDATSLEASTKKSREGADHSVCQRDSWRVVTR
jgi:hypothetical protein